MLHILHAWVVSYRIGELQLPRHPLSPYTRVKRQAYPVYAGGSEHISVDSKGAMKHRA